MIIDLMQPLAERRVFSGIFSVLGLGVVWFWGGCFEHVSSVSVVNKPSIAWYLAAGSPLHVEC